MDLFSHAHARSRIDVDGTIGTYSDSSYKQIDEPGLEPIFSKFGGTTRKKVDRTETKDFS